MPGEQRTERATPQRKQKARKQGDSVHSRELIAAVAMLAGVLCIGVFARQFIFSWGGVYAQSLELGASNLVTQPDAFWHSLQHILLPALAPVGMVMAAIFVAALAAGLAQSGGLYIRANALQPKFARLNPVTNLGNLFSLRSATRLGKSLVPAAIVVIFGVKAVSKLVGPIPAMSVMRLPVMFTTAYGLMLETGFVMLGWSALDYAMEWRAWNQRLRMSKQEMREEAKESQGSPQMKRKIRTLQRAMSQRKRRADVSRASVVITNPTHYAVALEFSFETMQAPMVLAKGKNLHALEIRKEAQWANVPIVENPPLARSLFHTVEVGQSIPYELYATVAGILAWLYRQQVDERAKAEKQKQGTEKRGTGNREAGNREQGTEKQNDAKPKDRK